MLSNFYQHARPLDILEVKHMTGKEFGEYRPEEMGETLTLVDEQDNVYAIGAYGYNDVFMLCTTKVEEHPVAFLRYVRDHHQQYIKKYHRYGNAVWLGNELHVKWLKWMGAIFGRIITINGEKFQEFYFEDKEGDG